jgi:hypothetical protein
MKCLYVTSGTLGIQQPNYLSLLRQIACILTINSLQEVFWKKLWYLEVTNAVVPFLKSNKHAGKDLKKKHTHTQNPFSTRYVFGTSHLVSL